MISSDRILLYEISQELTSDEVLRLTFSFADFIPKAHQEKIEDATDLFSALMRLQVLNEQSVEDLGRKFCLSQRRDLYDKICKYKGTHISMIIKKNFCFS